MAQAARPPALMVKTVRARDHLSAALSELRYVETEAERVEKALAEYREKLGVAVEMLTEQHALCSELNKEFTEARDAVTGLAQAIDSALEDLPEAVAHKLREQRADVLTRIDLEPERYKRLQDRMQALDAKAEAIRWNILSDRKRVREDGDESHNAGRHVRPETAAPFPGSGSIDASRTKLVGSASSPPTALPPPPGAVPPSAFTFSCSKTPALVPSAALTAPVARVSVGAPRTASHVTTLRCKDIVSAVAFSRCNPAFVFTGSKGLVSVWSLEQPDEPLRLVDYRSPFYLRVVRPLADGKHVVTGGESASLTVLAVTPAGIVSVRDQLSVAPFNACYSAVSGPDEHTFLTTGDPGVVLLWDLRQPLRHSAREFRGHTDAATCLDIVRDGSRFFSGSLDRTVNCWDVGMGRSVSRFRFQSPVYAVAVKPDESARPQLAVGLDSEKLLVIDLVDAETNHQWELMFHTGSILSIRYAHSGAWFMSTGKDHAVVAWRAPKGPSIFKASEPTSVLCCDISVNDQHFVTGSAGKTANVYRLDYSPAAAPS